MISDEAIEAAAKALCERGDSDWQDWTPEARVEAVEDMRAALGVVVPHMLVNAKAEAWDECAGGYLDQLVSITLNWEELPNPYRSQT